MPTVQQRELAARLSQFSLKVSSLEAYLQVLSVHLHATELLAGLNGSRRVREARLRRMSCKQHAMDGCVNIVAPDSESVVVFGSGFFGRRLRKGDSPKRPGVVRALRRHLARKRRVVLVNEYLTSQVCWKCSHKCRSANSDSTGHPSTRTEAGYLVLKPCCARMRKEDADVVHRDLYCHNHAGGGCRINRDLNAACNMMAIFHSLVHTGGRPRCLTKPKEEEPDEP